MSLETFIQKGGTKTQRQLRAALSLAIFPVALVASVIVGTIIHIYEGIREYVKDFKDLIVSDIPHAVTSLVRGIKTGSVR